MVLVWIVIGGIAVQFILAKYTAEDAHSRGHDETQWFLLVMIFGIFAIIIYLLTRNDRRIPESERPPNNLNPRLSSTLLYGGSSLVGFILFGWIIGVEVANELFTVNEVLGCESVTLAEYTDDPGSGPCVASEELTQTVERNWRITITASWLFGLIVPPLLIYLQRSRGILSQYF